MKEEAACPTCGGCGYVVMVADGIEGRKECPTCQDWVVELPQVIHKEE